MGEVILERKDKREIEEVLKIIQNLKPEEQRELLIFMRGMEFAKKILENMINKGKLHEIDILKVNKYYEDAVDKRIIVLDEPLFYKDYL